MQLVVEAKWQTDRLRPPYLSGSETLRLWRACGRVSGRLDARFSGGEPHSAVRRLRPAPALNGDGEELLGIQRPANAATLPCLA